MRLGNWKFVPALGALALATVFAPYAHAGCGLYRTSGTPRQLAAPDRLAATCTGSARHRRRGQHPGRTQHSRNLERALNLWRAGGNAERHRGGCWLCSVA